MSEISVGFTAPHPLSRHLKTAANYDLRHCLVEVVLCAWGRRLKEASFPVIPHQGDSKMALDSSDWGTFI